MFVTMLKLLASPTCVGEAGVTYKVDDYTGKCLCESGAARLATNPSANVLEYKILPPTPPKPPEGKK